MGKMSENGKDADSKKRKAKKNVELKTKQDKMKKSKPKSSKGGMVCCGCTRGRNSDAMCEDPMLSDHHQYQYMTGDDMKSMGDDSMRVNVTDDERDNRHSGVPTITEMITKESCYRQNVANLKPDNIDINRHPVHVGIPSWRNFLVSFLVDARGGAMRGCRHSGVRVIVPPRKATMPMRVTCRYLKRDKLTHPPPLMEGEALASRILELAPVAAKFLGPVIIEVPHFASLRGKEREIVILRSDNGETWREHTLEASEEAVQDVLNESFEGEELSQLEDLQTSRIVRILTVDFPHYFAVVSRIRQEVHAVGPEGGTVSSSAVPQVQAIFPPAALTKKIRVGLQAHPIPAELVAKLLGNRVAVSPIVTVEPRRRKFHKPISLTVPLPQAANKGMINQYSGDAPTLRLLCSITGGQSRAVWEDVTGSTPLTFLKDCVSFTTTVSARFWLMDCRNISEATKMATELYTHATHVPFMAKFVVFAKRTDPLEARLRVFCMTDDKEDKTLEHQEHFTEVAKSRDVEVLEGKTQYLEFAGNLIPVLKSGEQLQLPFRAFKENRIPFTVRIKDPDAADMMGRIMFMNEPKVAKGEPPQTPICTLNILLPDKISPGGNSELDLLELSKNYSFLRDGGLSRPDAIHRATIRLTDIANLLDKDWENLALELNLTPNEISQIKEEHPDKTAQQATAMFKLWQSNGNKATGNTLEKALNKIGREDIVKKCIFNVELVTDDVEKAVARVRLDQPGFDNLKDELGPSRDTSLRRDATMDPKMDPDFEEPDRMKDSESVEDLSITGAQNSTNQRITITNGTVYNATSTPIKDKYASDEKELVDDMSDFIEHKYHTTDTMMKQSRDELDDDNKKREEVLEEAKRIVSGVKRDAEKEKIKLSKKGWSVVYDNDVRKNDEVGNVLKQQEGSFSVDTGGVSEIPVIRQQCIIGTNGDRTITTITTRTIITTGEDDGTDLSNLAIHGEDSHDVTDFSDSRLSMNDSGAVRIDKSSGVSPKTHTVNETTEIAGRGKDLSKNIARNLDETVSGKKDKASRMFTGIFKTTKSKKNKSKDSRDVSLDSGDDEIKVSTAKLLDDIRRMSESTVDDPDLASTYTSTGQIENEFVGKNSAESARLNESEKNPESPSFFNKLRSPKSKGESKIRSKDKLLRQIPSSDNGEKSKTGATKSVVSMKPHDGEPVESAQSKEETHDTRVTEDLGYGKHGVTKDLDLGLNDPENSVLQRDEKDHGKSSGLLNIFRNPKSKMKKSKAEKVSKSLDSCSDPTDKRFATNDDDNIKTETEKFLDHNRYTLDITDLRKPDSVNLREDSVALEKQEQLAPSVVEKSEESIARDPVDDLYSKKSHHSASRQKGQAHYPEREVNDGESVARGGSELGDPSLKAEGGVVIEPKANDGTPNDPAKLNTLKGKEKAGGILSGILKSAKHAAEDITQEVKDFAGKARKEAEEEKDKDKVDSKNVSTSIKYEIEERVGGIKGDTLEGIRGPSATGEDSNEKVKIVVKTNEASHENSSISSISIVDKNTPKSGADLLLNTSITESTRNPDIDAVGHPVNQKLKKGKAKTGAIFSGIFNKGSKETRNAAVDDAIVLHGGSHPDPTGEIESKNISIGEVVENDEKNDNKVNSADLNSAQSSPVNVTGSIGLKVEKDINPELAIPSHNDDPGITQICKEERKGKIEKKNKGLLSGILKGAKNTAGDVAHVVGELEEEAEEEAIEDEKLMALYTSQISGNPTKSRKSAGYNDDLREENLMKDEEENMREKSPGSRVVLEGSGPQRKSNKLTERIVVCHAGEESSSDNDDIKKTKDLLEDMKSTASSWMVDVSQAPSHLSQNESLGTHVDTAEKKNRKKGGILSGFFKKVNSPNVEVVEESSSSSGGEKITTEDVKGETKKDVDTVKEQIGSIVGETDKNISNAPDGFANFSLSKNDSDPSIAGTLDLQRISKETGMEASIPAILEEKRKKKENDTEAPITGEIPSRKSKEKTTGFLAGIFKLPKQDSKEIATRSQDSENGTYGKEVNNEIGGTLHVDETVNADACGADEGLESKQIIVTYDSEFSRNATKDLLRDMQHNSTIPDTEISANEIDHQVESGISSEKNLKRKNPLSDLIQFPKSAAQKISHDIQEFVRETKREALEDKMKSKAKSGKISVDSEIDTDRVSKDQSHSSYLGLDTEKPTSYGGHDSSGKEAATKSGDDALKIGKSTYSLDEETSGNSEVSTKKNKAKTTKLLSGIFKSTKSKSEDITPHMTASSAVGVEIVAHKPKTIKPKVDVSTDGQKEESIHDMNDHSRKSDLNDPGPRVESSSVLLTEGNDAIGIPSPKRGDVSPGKNGNEQGRVDQKKSKKSKGIFTGLLDGAKHMAGEIVHDAEDFAKKTKVDELTEESKIESEEPKTNESRFLNVKKVGVPIIGLESPKESTRMPGTSIEKEIRSKNEHPFVHSTDKNSAGEAELSVGEVILQPKSSNQPILKKKKSRSLGGILRAAKDPSKPVYDDPITSLESVTTEDGLGNLIQDDKTATKQFLEDIKSSLMVSELPLNIILSEIGGDSSSRVTKTTGIRQSVSEDAEDDPNDKCAGEIMPGSDEHPGRENKHKSKGFMSGIFKTRKQSVAEVEGKSHRVKSSNIEGLENQAMIASHQQFDGVTSGDGIPEGGVVVDSNVGLTQISLERDRSINDGQTESTHGSTPINNDRGRRTPLLLGEMENVACKIRNEEKEVKMNAKDAIEDVKASENVIQGIPSSMANETIGQMKEEKAHSTKAVDKSVPGGESTNTSVEIEIEGHTSPQAKKKVKKARGLLSGVFKGARNTAEGVAHEVEDLLEESERKIVEEERKFTSKVIETSDHARDELGTRIGDSDRRVSDTARYIKDKVDDRLEEGRLKLHEGLKELDRVNIQDQPNIKLKATSSDETVNRASRDSMEPEDKHPKMKKHKEKGRGFLSNIIKNAKTPAGVAGDEKGRPLTGTEEEQLKLKEKSDDVVEGGGEVVEGSIGSEMRTVGRANMNIGSDSVNRETSSANKMMELDDGKDSVVLADHVIGDHGTSHPRKKDKKSGGLLSGLFKSAKNAAEGYVEVTEQTVLEEERKVKADLNEKALKAQAELDAQIYELDEAISETGHDLKKEIDIGIEKEKLRINEQVEALKVGNSHDGTESVNQGISSANETVEHDDGKDSVVLADRVIGEHGTSHPRKKDKKSGGLLSGLFKSAKNAAEGYVEVTEQTILEEERKVKADLNEKALKAQAELDAQIYELDEAISETGHDLKKEIDTGIEKEKLRINEQVEALKVGNSHDNTESVNRGIPSANETVEQDDGKDSVVLADRVIGDHGTSHPRKKDKKSGGLLSGLFKSAKNATEDYVEVTEQNVLEEERKVKADLNEKALEARDGAGTQIHKLDKAIVETGKDLKREVDAGIEEEKLRVNEQMDRLKIGNYHDGTESVNREISSANKAVKLDDGKNSVVLADRSIDEHESSPPREKDNKSGGLLSGLFKSAKNATEDCVEVTKQAIPEEESKVKAELSGKALVVRDRLDTQIHELDGAISETEHDLKKEIDARVEKGKLRVHKEMEGWEEGDPRDSTTFLNREMSSANKMMELDDGKDSVVLVDRAIDDHESSHPRKKDKKSGGLLSGLFRSAKNAAKDHVEITEQTSSEEERKVKADLSGKTTEVRDGLDAHIPGLNKAISETEQNLKKEIHADVERGKLRVREQIEKLEEGKAYDTVSADRKMVVPDEERPGIVDLRPSSSEEAHNMNKKNKERDGGFFLGLFKGSKTSAENVKNGGKEFAEKKTEKPLESEERIGSTIDLIERNADGANDLSERNFDLPRVDIEFSNDKNRIAPYSNVRVEHASEGCTGSESFREIDDSPLAGENNSDTLDSYKNNDHKLPLPKELEKKPRGFLTGILRTTKNALGGVTREVENLVDETKQKVIDEELNVASQVDKVAKTIENNSEILSEEAKEEVSTRKQEIMDQISSSVQEIESESQKVHDKVLTSLGQTDKVGEAAVGTNVIINTQKEENDESKRKQKTSGFFSGIFKNAKSTTVEEHSDGKSKSGSELPNSTAKRKESEPRLLVSSGHDIPATVCQSSNLTQGDSTSKARFESQLDSGKNIRFSGDVEDTEFSSNEEDLKVQGSSVDKSKDPMKQFLSDILGTAKVIPENTAYHVNEFLEETRREASEEIRRIMTSSQRSAMAPENLTNDLGIINNDQKQLSDKDLSLDTQTNEDMTMSSKKQKMLGKPEIPNQIEGANVDLCKLEKTAQAISTHKDRHEKRDSEDAIDSISGMSSDELKSSPEKEKPGNFFSNLFKGAKNTATGVAQDVRIITNKIENEVIENEDQARESSQENVLSAKKFVDVASQDIDISSNSSGIDMARSEEMRTKQVTLDKRNVMTNLPELKMRKNQPGLDGTDDSFGASEQKEVKSHGKKEKNKAGGFFTSLLKSANHPKKGTASESSVNPQIFSEEVMDVADNIESKSQEADNDIQRTLDKTKEDIDELIDTCGKRSANTGAEINQKVSEISTKVSLIGKDTSEELQSVGERIEVPPESSRDETLFQISAAHDKPMAKSSTDPQLVGNSSHFSLNVEKRKKPKLLAGFFTSAKQAVGGVAHGIDEFVEETKEEVLKAEEKIKADSQKKASDLNTVAVDSVIDFNNLIQQCDAAVSPAESELKRDVEYINTAAGSTKDGVRERTDDIKEELNNAKALSIGTGSDILSKIESSASQGKFESDHLKTEISKQVSSSVSEGKEKSKGILSGFLKGSKRVTGNLMSTVDEPGNEMKGSPKKHVTLETETKQIFDPVNDKMKVDPDEHPYYKSTHESMIEDANETVGKMASVSTISNSNSNINPDIRHSSKRDIVLANVKTSVLPDEKHESIIEGAVAESASLGPQGNPKSTDIVVDDTSISLIHDAHKSESDSAKGSLKREYSDEREGQKTSKSKSGVLSGIIKKTKGASHKIAKELDHATESLKGATEKFWEDAKRESMDSKRSGSYDVTPSLIDPELTKDEIASNSDLGLEPSNPMYSPLTIAHDTESHIPKVIQSCHICEESTVQIVQESITIVQSEVSSSFSHSEPQAHQTVTTVIKKSVRTASTPPPSPAEFTDDSSQEITEEAERRAQVLIDARSLGKSENDLLQQSDPTFVETTTTEIDPDTHERITRVTRTMTSTHGAIDDREELRDSMHKIVDDFISEERRGQ